MVHLKTGEAASSERGASKKASMMTGAKDLNIDGVKSQSESGGENLARRHFVKINVELTGTGRLYHAASRRCRVCC